MPRSPAALRVGENLKATNIVTSQVPSDSFVLHTRHGNNNRHDPLPHHGAIHVAQQFRLRRTQRREGLPLGLPVHHATGLRDLDVTVHLVEQSWRHSPPPTPQRCRPWGHTPNTRLQCSSSILEDGGQLERHASGS